MESALDFSSEISAGISTESRKVSVGVVVGFVAGFIVEGSVGVAIEVAAAASFSSAVSNESENVAEIKRVNELAGFVFESFAVLEACIALLLKAQLRLIPTRAVQRHKIFHELELFCK